MNKILEIHQIEFRVKSESRSGHEQDFCLRGDFILETGKKYLLLGPSGAGKSTFFDGISGFIQPVKGEIRYANHNLKGVKPSHRPVSLLQQSYNLFSHLTGRENLQIIKPRCSDRENFDKKLDKTLKDLHIESLQHRRASLLSGGEKTRFALARIILEDQPIWLLDEPFSSLGPALRKESRSLIVNALKNMNKIAILASHLGDDLIDWPDEIIWVEQGIIHAPQAVEKFLKTQNSGAKQYLGL